MWKLTLKQIWRNRKFNFWIFIEIMIVSVLLWYCVDFLYVAVRKNLEPMGVNTEHVYRLKLGSNPTMSINRETQDSIQEQWINPFLQVVRTVEEYPGIETVAYSVGTEPFGGGSIIQGYTADEKNRYIAKIRYVSENYDKVFKVEMHEGGFTDWNIKTSPQGAVVSPELADSLFHSQLIIGKTFQDYYQPELTFRVKGVSAPMKFNIYDRYDPFIYTPFNIPRLAYHIPTIALRVSPEADMPGFEQRFIEDMKGNLNIGPFYLFSLISYDFKSEVYNTVSGVSNYLTIISSLLSFFLFIVFLGILGTFWFQMESRRSEIGLRMALGSSRKGVLRQILFESMVIFLLAFSPALIISINLAYWDVTFTFNNAMDYNWNRFWITQFFTAIIMMGIISLGALIPAYRASKVHPVDALRDE